MQQRPRLPQRRLLTRIPHSGICRSSEKSNFSGVATNAQDKVKYKISRVLLYFSLHILFTVSAFLYHLSSNVRFCAICLFVGTMQLVSSGSSSLTRLQKFIAFVGAFHGSSHRLSNCYRGNGVYTWVRLKTRTEIYGKKLGSVQSVSYEDASDQLTRTVAAVHFACSCVTFYKSQCNQR
jgi:hypothetical protein